MPRQIVEPQGVIKLLANVPLDTTYDHTIFFADRTTQYNYFAGLAAYSLPAQSYTRQSNGAIRVEINSEQLWLRNVNYLMFQNAGFTAANAKWFYAFITDIVYINNVTSEIRFQLDPMQSWLMHVDYTMKQCFVAREHAITDNPGDNLLDEGLELGDYILEPALASSHGRMYDSGFNPGQYYICIPSTKIYMGENNPLIDASGAAQLAVQHGVFTGLGYNWFKNENRVGGTEYYRQDALIFLQKIQDLANGEAALTSIYMTPSVFKDIIDNNTSPTESIGRTTGVGAYVPRNKKLLTYPYNFITVSDHSGNTYDYHYEYFALPESCTFKLIAAFSAGPVMAVIPQAYNNVADNINELMILDTFPQCACALDQFRAWMAQMRGTVTTAIAKAKINSTIAGLTGFAMNQMSQLSGRPATPFSGELSAGLGKMSAYGSLANNILDYLREKKVASTQPDKVFGDQVNTLNIANDYFGFYAYRTHVRQSYAEIIDEYFDKYGYATNRNKIPNIYANSGSNSFPRKVWCYTQTADCNIEGSVPAPIAESICNIFNKGITFWKHTATVGDYSQDNTV